MVHYIELAISDSVVQLLGISEVLPCAGSIIALGKQLRNQVSTWSLSLS